MSRKIFSKVHLLILFQIFVFGLAAAQSHMDFQVYMEPGKTFVSPSDFNTYYMGNTDIYLDVQIENDGDISNSAYIMPLRFYAKIDGIETDGIPFEWVPLDPPFISTYKDGGISYDYSWRDNAIGCEPMNGFATALMNSQDTVVVRPGWNDGTLPDTMAYAGISTAGIPLNQMLTRLRFHFNVPVQDYEEVVEICIDSSGFPAETQYDWFFDNPTVFSGPYCFDFSLFIPYPPIVNLYPLSLTTSHKIPFNVTYETYSLYDFPITGCGAIDENGDPLGTATLIYGGSFIRWVFDPPCQWINDGLTHRVGLYLEDIYFSYPIVDIAYINLTVTESGPPNILGDCDKDILANINETETADFSIDQYSRGGETWIYSINHNVWGQKSIDDGLLSFTPAEGDDGKDYIFTVRVTDCLGYYDECDVTYYVRSSYLCGDPNNDSKVDILDIVYLINALYKNGPGPGPLEICDVNNDGVVNILDIVKIVTMKYKGGPPLNCPPRE